MNTVTTPALLTAEEFAEKYAGDYAELIDGIAVEGVPVPKLKHGVVCARAARFICGFVEDNNLGVACSNDTFVLTRRNPDRVRGADACFWPNESVPEGELPGILVAPPALVAEVRSPSETWSKAFAKVLEYLEAGVKVVILFDPGSATASVYRPDELQQIFDNGDELTVPDVLPGFRVPVRRFFE